MSFFGECIRLAPWQYSYGLAGYGGRGSCFCMPDCITQGQGYHTNRIETEILKAVILHENMRMTAFLLC